MDISTCNSTYATQSTMMKCAISLYGKTMSSTISRFAFPYSYVTLWHELENAQHSVIHRVNSRVMVIDFGLSRFSPI